MSVNGCLPLCVSVWQNSFLHHPRLLGLTAAQSVVSVVNVLLLVLKNYMLNLFSLDYARKGDSNKPVIYIYICIREIPCHSTKQECPQKVYEIKYSDLFILIYSWFSQYCTLACLVEHKPDTRRKWIKTFSNSCESLTPFLVFIAIFCHLVKEYLILPLVSVLWQTTNYLNKTFSTS